MTSTNTRKERPILFDSCEIAATRTGNKTQFRRPMKPQPNEDWLPDTYDFLQRMTNGVVCEPDEKRDRWGVCNEDGDEGYFCPFGAPGDLLWVRESYWQQLCLGFDCVDEIVASWGHRTQHAEERQAPGYLDPEHRIYMVKRPSIHMPRSLSRITLKITSLRVERLQGITREDAIAEGMLHHPAPTGTVEVNSFAKMWDSTHAKKGFAWATNPWVWVVGFKVLSNERGEQQ